MTRRSRRGQAADVGEGAGAGPHRVAVLLMDEATDLLALEKATERARTGNGRLIVVISPLIPRWILSFSMLAGVTPQQHEEDAAKRCVAAVLTRVPRDLPTTIRIVLHAKSRIVAGILSEPPQALVFAGPALARPFAARMRRAVACRCPGLVTIVGDTSRQRGL